MSFHVAKEAILYSFEAVFKMIPVTLVPSVKLKQPVVNRLFGVQLDEYMFIRSKMCLG